MKMKEMMERMEVKKKIEILLRLIPILLSVNQLKDKGNKDLLRVFENLVANSFDIHTYIIL